MQPKSKRERKMENTGHATREKKRMVDRDHVACNQRESKLRVRDVQPENKREWKIESTWHVAREKKRVDDTVDFT